MNSVAFLNGVMPGPACVIPEEKKIFRVSGDDGAANAVSCEIEGVARAECSDGAPALPVPHMYSA